ncbi:MAG: DUF4157 domain-containing protein [Cyanobacteria bacterium P01_E01_bin.42]
MTSKRIHQHQPDRHSQPAKSASRRSEKEAPLEVAEITPGAMMDNVMRSTPADYSPSTLPQVFLQPKLTIGEPGDKYEQEADRMAKEVIQRIHAPADNSGNVLQRQFNLAGDRFAPMEVDAETLQSKTEVYRQVWGDILQGKGVEAGGTVNDDFEGELNRARSGGQLLEPKLQNQMGEAFGADFSRVKVHTDAQSHNLNQSIQAKAFTTGQDIFFKGGEYQPGSQSGQELIAHELTHVVQQNGSAIQKKEEQETESNESLADSIQRQGEPTIQRFWDENKCVKLPRKGKILKGGTLVDWSNTNKIEVWQKPESEVNLIDYQTHEGEQFFVFQDTQGLVSQQKEHWWGVYEDIVTFQELSIYDIAERKREWKEVLKLPTKGDGQILNDDDIVKLQEKFLTKRTEFIENVIDGKIGDELKYRLQGCVQKDSLEKGIIDEYATQKLEKIRIDARELEWTNLELNDPGKAKENYLKFSDDDAKKFRVILYDTQVESQARYTTAIAALSNGSSIQEIKKAIANKAREEEWPSLGIEALFNDPELSNKTKAKYLELDNTEAKKFGVLLSAWAENIEKKKEKVKAFADGAKTLDTLFDEARQSAEKTRREKEWETFDFKAGGNVNEQALNTAKQNYLNVENPKHARRFGILVREQDKKENQKLLLSLSQLQSIDTFYLDVLLDPRVKILRKMKERIQSTYKIELTGFLDLKELEDMEAALERFKYLLGDSRKIGMDPQKLAKVIRQPKGDDAQTAGMNQGNTIYMYDPSHEIKDFIEIASKETLEERRQGFRGTMTHELTHALIADTKIRDDATYHKAYAETLDFWQTPKQPTYGGGSWDKRIENGKLAGIEVPITTYGADEAEEDLCEAVMMYFEKPAVLQKKCPIRFRFIQEKIKPLLDKPIG